MDAVALLHRAQEVGLRIEPMGDKLLVRGPKRAEAVVKLLAEHKAEVLAVLGNTVRESELLAPMPLFEKASAAEGEPGHEILAPRGAAELKKWKVCFCTSASSAAFGPSAMASVFVPAGSAAGIAASIGQKSVVR